MTKITVDIDARKAAQARRLLGANTLRETIDRALDLLIEVDARRRAAERLEHMQGLDLVKPEVMRKAWR